MSARIHQHYDIEITEIIEIFFGGHGCFTWMCSVNVSGRADPAPTVDVIGHPQGMPLRETITPCGCLFLLHPISACEKRFAPPPREDDCEQERHHPLPALNHFSLPLVCHRHRRSRPYPSLWHPIQCSSRWYCSLSNRLRHS